MRIYKLTFYINLVLLLSVFSISINHSTQHRDPAQIELQTSCIDLSASIINPKVDTSNWSEEARYFLRILEQNHIEYKNFQFPDGELGIKFFPSKDSIYTADISSLLDLFTDYSYIYKDTFLENDPNIYFKDDSSLFINKKYIQNLLDDRQARSRPDSFKEFFPQFFENVSKKLANDHYEGLIKTIESNDKKVISISVGEKIGSGAFGIVHRCTINSFIEEAITLYPDFFQNNLPRSDLVIKFPHNITLPVPRHHNPWIRMLNNEVKETEQLGALINNPQISPEIVYAETGKYPFLIKPYIDAIPIAELAKTQHILTQSQIISLKRDIYDKAKELISKHNVSWDIRPENLGWDTEQNIFRNYEASSGIPINLAKKLFFSGDFKTYLNYFEKRMMYWRDK